MAKCDDCKVEMQNHVGCTYGDVMVANMWHKRDLEHFGEDDGICGDCGAPHGSIHHQGYDVERCPACGGQLISCDCDVSHVGKGQMK